MGAAAVGLSAVMVASCGGGHVPSARESDAACRRGGDPAVCLRLLDRAVGVTSVRLTSNVPLEINATCSQTARMTRIRVTCPPLVPAGGLVGDHELYGPQLTDRRSYSMSINNGQNPGRIHWEIGAIKGPPRALWIFDRREWAALGPKRPVTLIGERRYSGSSSACTGSRTRTGNSRATMWHSRRGTASRISSRYTATTTTTPTSRCCLRSSREVPRTSTRLSFRSAARVPIRARFRGSGTRSWFVAHMEERVSRGRG